jgi:hypothetical protein
VFHKRPVEFATMRIWNGNGVRSLTHIPVTFPRERAFPTEQAHSPNQLAPANRLRHIPALD